jgi:hypothetical protein
LIGRVCSRIVTLHEENAAPVYRLTRLALRAPLRTGFVLLLVTAGLALGVPKVRSEFGYRSLLGGDHPSIQQLEDFIERFGGGFPMLVVWSCGDGSPCQSVFDDASLRMADALHERLASEPEIASVHSPARAPLLVPAPGGFDIRRLVENGRPAADAARLGERAASDPTWAGQLVSSDGDVGALVLSLADSRHETMQAAVAAVEEALVPYEAQGFAFHLVGHPIESIIAGREMAASIQNVAPLSALLIAAIIWLLTRSWQSTAIAMGTMGVAILWTLGLLGWLGWPQDTILQILPTFVLVIGVCDAVHVLNRFGSEVRSAGARATGAEREAAILRATREVAPPCVMTTLTTAGAFLSFLTSDLATFVRFGTIMAFGVTACLFLTFSLLPLLVRWLPASPAPARQSAEWWAPLLGAVARTAERRAFPVLGATLGLTIVSAIGMLSYLETDTDINRMWGEQSRVTRWIEFVDQNLRGLDSLEIAIGFPDGTDVIEPETQQKLGEFVAFLESSEGLGRTISVRDLLGRMNRAFHDDDPAFERPADTAAENGSLLELAGFNDPRILQPWLSFDWSYTRISVEGPSATAHARGETLERVRGFAAANLPAEWEFTLTGPFAMEFDWVTQIQQTQTWSFATAFLIVLVLVTSFLRSLRLGLLAMIPALVPVVVTLGFMGFAGMALDVGRIMIAAIAIGISVDDSIHLLTDYKRRCTAGARPADAMRASLLHVGRPIVITSLALALGMLTLMTSAWQSISSFGFFIAMAILGALVGALFVVPATVFARHRSSGESDEEAAPVEKKGAPAPRAAVLLLITAPLACVLGLAFVDAIQSGDRAELACWMLPNGRVVQVPFFTGGCPLATNDQIEAVGSTDGELRPVHDLASLSAALASARGDSAVGVRTTRTPEVAIVPLWRAGTSRRVVRVAAAGAAALALLAIPALLLWRSRSASAAPLASFYASLGVLMIVLVCGEQSPALQMAGLVAFVALPATLGHLSLAFPRERQVLRERPAVALLPYAAAAIGLPVAWVAQGRLPALWPSVLYLLVILAVSTWIVVLVSCGFVMRESSLAVERARAKLLVFAGLLLPILPTAVLAEGGVHGRVVAYVGSALVLFPLPIALAISRYNLFDLDDGLRRVTAQVSYAALGGVFVAAIVGAAMHLSTELGLGELTLLAATAVLVAEVAREPILGFLGAHLSPRRGSLESLHEAFTSRMQELRSEPEIGRALGEALTDGLGPRTVWVFYRIGGTLRAAYGTDGSRPSSARADDAWRLLRGRACVHLVAEPREPSAEAKRLREDGFELLIALAGGEADLGIVLVSERVDRRPYLAYERRCAMGLAGAAGLALHNARLAGDLAAAQVKATLAHVAIGFVHNVRKKVDWIAAAARDMAGRAAGSGEETMEAKEIEVLATDAIEQMTRFLKDAASEGSTSAKVLALDSLLERCARLGAPNQDGSRITLDVEAEVQWWPVSEALEGVLANLVDNAFNASASDGSVRIEARRAGEMLEVSVVDHGCGMEPEVLRACEELWFTTRERMGGHGVGLAFCKETVARLGGSLTLESARGVGTRATVRIPALPSSRPGVR